MKATPYERKLNEILDLCFDEAAERNLSWIALANLAELHTATVYRIGNRETKLPRFKTVFQLCDCLGLAIHAERIKLRKAM